MEYRNGQHIKRNTAMRTEKRSNEIKGYFTDSLKSEVGKTIQELGISRSRFLEDAAKLYLTQCNDISRSRDSNNRPNVGRQVARVLPSRSHSGIFRIRS